MTDQQKTEFEKMGEEKQLTLLQEFAVFIMENKKWWLIPILAVMFFVGLVVVLSSTGLAPFVYTIF